MKQESKNEIVEYAISMFLKQLQAYKVKLSESGEKFLVNSIKTASQTIMKNRFQTNSNFQEYTTEFNKTIIELVKHGFTALSERMTA